jgi:hypothetical protein
MPVNQDIQKFYSEAASRDFSRDFLFRVTQLNIQGMPPLLEGQLVYAKAADLPGRNITNVPVPYMGLNFNVPGGTTYPGSDGYTLAFYLDADCALRNYFEDASRVLFDDQTSTGIYGTPDDNTYIQLAQLDKNLEPINIYKLHGASLRNVSNISYNMAAGTGQTVDITTTIAYHFYTQQLVVAPF